MRSGIKQLATCLLVLLGAGAAHAINPGIYKAIDENDSVRLAGLLDKEMPVGRLAANVLNYAALTGDDKGVQVLLAHGVPASQTAVQVAGDGTDPRSGFGGHLLTARYLKSVMQDPALAKIEIRKLKIVESNDADTFKEMFKPPFPTLDASREMKGILAKDLMYDLIQFSNHEGMEKLLKTDYVTSGAVIIGLEAAARYSEDICLWQLLNYCRDHKEIHVNWDRLVKLASDPDPEEPGSGGHPLLGLYIRSVQQSRGALAGASLASLGFQGR